MLTRGIDLCLGELRLRLINLGFFAAMWQASSFLVTDSP